MTFKIAIERSGRLQRRIRLFPADDSGATAIEYAIIAAGISIAIAAVVPEIGSAVSGMFTAAKDGL